MILVDTREQLPIWSELNGVIEKRKLNEGDYTTTDLFGKAHIERKSGIDLYGSLIQGHDRFRSEILRAQEKGLKLSIFVECPKEIFIGKRFMGGFRLQTPPARLRKIISTMETKYHLEFVWCRGREDFRSKAIEWFKHQREIHNA